MSDARDARQGNGQRRCGRSSGVRAGALLVQIGVGVCTRTPMAIVQACADAETCCRYHTVL